jgi:hypothetical protein
MSSGVMHRLFLGSSATPSVNPIHDFSQQEKGFAYVSSFIDPTTRVSLIAGTATSAFQIPNVPGQPVGQAGNPPVTSAYGITDFNSALLDETQIEDTQYAVLALQRSLPGFDGQVSYFTRYNWLHFVRTRLAICCSTVLPRTSVGNHMRTVFRVMPHTRSTRRIRFAPASR